METIQIQQPWQFAHHDRVSKTPPPFPMWDRVVEAFTEDKPLTRAEKDQIFHALQGNSGSASYKLGGWVFPFGQFMTSYFVKHSYNNHWNEVQAFDKTCIRYSWYTNRQIEEILTKPDK